MLAWAINFLHPAMLWFSVAAAAPVILHLVMRAKPREIVLPTMRFVLKSHHASLARQRLKHLLLLAMRVLGVCLLALLLAGPMLGGGGGQRPPVALAVAIDNSGSMGYRFGEQTHLAAGKALAQQIVQQLPADSRVAVLYGAGGGSEADLSAAQPPLTEGLTADRARALRRIAEAPQTFDAVDLATLLDRAADALAASPLERKLILLVNDRTAASWQSIRLGHPAQRAGLPVLLADCWTGEDVNFALREPRVTPEVAPLGTPAAVRTSVRCGAAAGQVRVSLLLSGRPTDQKTVTFSRPHEEVVVEFPLPTDAAGDVHGQIALDGDDPLAMDDERYFAMSVEPLRTMLVVRDATVAAQAEMTSFLMARAVAPSARAGGQVVTPHEIASDALDTAALADTALVLLANVSAVRESQWRQLEEWVKAGGRLWIVPGRLTSLADLNSPAAQALLPVHLAEAQTADSSFRLDATALAGPYVEPFLDGNNPPLSAVGITRRLRADRVAEGASVRLAYEDGSPAVVSRPLGQGSVLWWSFSPVEGWSNLRELAQFPILASRAAVVLLGADRHAMNYALGQDVLLNVPTEYLAASAVAQRLTFGDGVASGGQEHPVTINRRTGRISLSPRQVGLCRVSLSSPDRPAALSFAVNAPEAESDLALLPADQIAQLLAPVPLTAEATDFDRALAGGKEASRHDLRPLLALLAAVLLIGESFLANRFYRQAGFR